MGAKADRVERGATLLRRQGMADACVLLTAARFRGEISLEQWGDVLGISQVEMQAAVARFKAAHAPPPPPPAAPRPKPAKPKKPERDPDAPGEFKCEQEGCTREFDTHQARSTHRRRDHAEPVLCPNGCGRTLNPVGVGPHLRFCTGATAEEAPCTPRT